LVPAGAAPVEKGGKQKQKQAPKSAPDEPEVKAAGGPVPLALAPGLELWSSSRRSVLFAFELVTE
jgi:hypothetical protein